MSDTLERTIRKETFDGKTLDFSNYFTLKINSCYFRNCHIIIKNIPGLLLLTSNEYENCTYDFDFSNVKYRDIIGHNDRCFQASNIPIQKAIDVAYKPLFKITDELIGYKLLKDELGDMYLAKLAIPSEANKVSPFNSKKCRADKATVLSIKKISSGKEYSKIIHHCFSRLGMDTIYEVGSSVCSRNFNLSRYEVCTGGIHFYLSIEDLIEDFIVADNCFWDSVKASLKILARGAE